MASRRSYGTGSLYQSENGRMWIGHWRSSGRQVKRAVGPVRQPGGRTGLTRTQAEAKLRELIADTQVKPRVGERLEVDEVARRYLRHKRASGPQALDPKNIESEVRVHLAPLFGSRSMDAIKTEDVLDLVTVLEAKDLAPKTIKNIVATLSALFNFAKGPQRRWATANPCEGLELPAVPDATEIRFLTLDEVDALVAHARPGMFQAIDRAMYRTAAMTGLRQGELIALRWRDVDWMAARIRVRQNYVLGEFGTPKSKRSTRSVPMADEVGGRARPTVQAVAMPGRRRSRVRSPGDRRADLHSGRIAPVPQGAQSGGARHVAPLPRSAPHVRDQDGGGRRAAAHVAGVDGPPRPRDDADLRRLRAEHARGADGRRRVRARGR